MEPTGDPDPDIYILGEAPGKNEDQENEQFVGESGRYLRDRIPRDAIKRMRFNNTVRCRPPDNRTPDYVEVECCRPSIRRDIEATKPLAIFGFGNVPLNWATGKNGIANWRGRYMPIQVGEHKCWYFAFHHPAYLLHQRRATNRQFIEDERMFALDLDNALALLPLLPEPEPHSKADALVGIEWRINCTHADALYIRDFLRQVVHEPFSGMDYEATGLRPYRPDFKILSVAVAGAESSLAFPLFHSEARWSEADLDIVLDAFCSYLTEQNHHKISHNLAFEQEVTGVVFGRDMIRTSDWDDSMSQAFVIDQRVGGGKDDDENMECFSLGFLTTVHFGIDIKQLSKVNRKHMASEPLAVILPYNAVDAKYHRALFISQAARIEYLGLEHVYQNHLRRIPTVVLTQIKGVPLDFDVADNLAEKYHAKIAALQQDIARNPAAALYRQRTGKTFNPGSNKDVLALCARVIGVPVDSVEEKTLLRIDHPIIKPILDLRGVSKLLSTYVFQENSPVVYPDGHLHPMLNAVKARTSRLTSSEPNEQNMPLRDAEGKEIRKQIAAPPGYIILSVDEGQIEHRVFGMASKDKVVVDQLWDGYDVHMDWARRIGMEIPRLIGGKKGLSDVKVMKDFRQFCKSNWVFANFFGAQLATAAGRFQCDESDLAGLYRAFWNEFSGVRDWQLRNQAFYEKHGYVELLTGRRRCGPLSVNQVTNTPIQGTANEIVIDAMNRLSEMEDWDLQPIMNIHDDLKFILPESNLADYIDPICREMVRKTFDFINVPLIVEISVGKNLFEMEEIGSVSSETIQW